MAADSDSYLPALGGRGTLEVFTYTPPTRPRTGLGEPGRLGFRAVGVTGTSMSPGPVTGHRDVPLEVVA